MGGNPELAFATGKSSGIDALESLGVHDVSEKTTQSIQWNESIQKGFGDEIRYVSADEENLDIGKGMTARQKVDNMEEIALFALHVDDDTTLNPWTVSMVL